MTNICRQTALLLAAFAIPANVSAMNSIGHCSVVAGEKLPPSSGGAEAICSEVERAVASVAPHATYEAEITVLSPARIAARLVVNGRTLPEQRLAITDRELNRGAIERFAQALAVEVAKAANP